MIHWKDAKTGNKYKVGNKKDFSEKHFTCVTQPHTARKLNGTLLLLSTTELTSFLLKSKENGNFSTVSAGETNQDDTLNKTEESNTNDSPFLQFCYG